MTTTAERIHLTDLQPAEPRGLRRPIGVFAAVVAAGLAGWSLTLTPGSPTAGQYVRVAVVVLWALCGVSLVWRRPKESMGFIVTGFAITGAVWALGASLHLRSGSVDVGDGLRALGFALLPAVAMHIIFGLPDGAHAKP
jgi:hypothetical protein